jgi:muramoyltetrapeptide carboxypeptidase
MQLIIPPYLKKGETIAIAAPARSISMAQMQKAIDYVESKGFKIFLHPLIFEVENQMAGSENTRAELFNDLLKNTEIKAIWCARGGYGSAKMVDLINFDLLVKNPKWICGFSDVTVLLNHIITNCKMACLHSSMPIFMNEKKGMEYQEVCNAYDSMLSFLEGNSCSFNLSNNDKLNNQDFEGQIIGGNLSVLMSIIGSKSECDWIDKILFIEDLDEYYYHIDRMMLALKRSGKLETIKALLVGSFISMHDHTIPFGSDVKQIIKNYCAAYNYPIIFDVNVGHNLENLALPFGIVAKYINGNLTFVNS